MSNYGDYWEATNGVFNHLWVYNNIASVTNSNLGTHSSGGFVVEQKIAGTMNDIVLANNTVVDLQPVGSRAITMLANGNGTYTNSVLANNLLVNSNTVERDAGTPTPSGNVNITGANAATYLVSYTLYGGSSNNLHLTSAASTVIGAGADLSAYFTVDKDGLTRTAPWDVGAFKYVAAGGAGGSQMAGKISLSGKVTIK